MTVPTADIMDERSVSMLRWRCRRGLLENDLYIEKFFERHGSTLSVRLGEALNRLMELGDHDLLDLQLARKTLDQVCPHLDDANTREVLSLLRENR